MEEEMIMFKTPRNNFLNENIHPLEVWVKSEFITDDKIQGKLYPGVAFAIASIDGRVLSFHVELESGAVYGRVPIHGLLWKSPVGEQYVMKDLQVYDCMSYYVSAITYDFLAERRCNVWIPSCKKYVAGKYHTTIDWAFSSSAETPTIYKSAAIILLDNGQVAGQPNNRIVW
tara:strand:- start:273 stop:788 length:516 start_codon:yes stop_codon:yes gene_type:complete